MVVVMVARMVSVPFHFVTSQSKALTERRMKRRGIGQVRIRVSAEQAKKNKVEYFGVDTCCIDKSSSDDLSEAIRPSLPSNQSKENRARKLTIVIHK